MSIKNPLVSVIIPSYNSWKYICDAIDSVLNQTYKRFEIIIVNDWSTDNTKDLINNNYKRSNIIYYDQINGWPAEARNLWIRKSKWDLIAFLDSDDIWLPQKLEFQIKLHKENKDPIFSFTKRSLLIKNKKTEATERLYSWYIYGRLLRQNYICISSVIIDKKIIDSIWLQNNNRLISLVADYEYRLRISRKFRWFYCDKILVAYRIHESQMTDIKYKSKNKFINTKILLFELKKNLFSRFFFDNLYYLLKMFIYESIF